MVTLNPIVFLKRHIFIIIIVATVVVIYLQPYKDTNIYMAIFRQYDIYINCMIVDIGLND